MGQGGGLLSDGCQAQALWKSRDPSVSTHMVWRWVSRDVRDAVDPSYLIWQCRIYIIIKVTREFQHVDDNRCVGDSMGFSI